MLFIQYCLVIHGLVKVASPKIWLIVKNRNITELQNSAFWTESVKGLATVGATEMSLVFLSKTAFHH